MSDPILVLSAITKRFGREEVLKRFDLTVRDGEFFTLLGSSGCGKSTVLRLIAGLESADTGSIRLAGEEIATLPAERRPVNTVFQSYALFPHMSVFDNVAFGLRMSRVAQAEIGPRVDQALAVVQLSDYANRRPHQLSGGQQQRVAIARALVNRPRVLLLDESLSALDYKLRRQMQTELKQLQRQLGITFIYVTHDQEEALSMSDRLLVMDQGRAVQIGTPREIYEEPCNLFVARFIGEINIFTGCIQRSLGESCYLAQVNGVEKTIRFGQQAKTGDEVHILLRPEDLRVEYISNAPVDGGGFVGSVVERNYTGQTLDSLIRLENGQDLQVSEFFNEDDPDFDYRIGERVWVDWVAGWEHVIPKGFG